MNKKKFLKIVIGVVAILSFPLNVFAETNIDFGKVDISKTGSTDQQKFYYELKEGEVKQDIIRVKNSSNAPITFTLLAADSKVDSKDYFILNGKDEKNTDIGSWISFSESAFTVEAGKGKDIPFNIKVPNNADVGLHKGGVVVQRFLSTDDGLGLNLQQGVPITVKVMGTPTPGMNFSNQEFQDSGNAYNVFYGFENSGNVSFNGRLRVSIKNTFSGGERVYEQNVVVPRGGENFFQFSWSKPLFGIYNVQAELIDNATNNVLNISTPQKFVFIAYLEIFLLLVIIVCVVFRKAILSKLYNIKDKKIARNFLAILLVATMLFYVQARFPVDDNEGATSIIVSDLNSSDVLDGTYYLVLRWGHLRDGLADPNDVSMDGKLSLTGATMQVAEELSFDDDDSYNLKAADQVVELSSVVKDDYDGLVLAINSHQEKPFNIAFEDHVRNMVSVYSIEELTKGAVVQARRGSPFTFGKAEMKLLRTQQELDSYLESQKIRTENGSSDVLLTFNSATPDIESKDVLDKEETLAILSNILSERSATPDVDNSIKLNPDFVESIVQSETGSEILASKNFIADLLASPAVLAALAATAQANVIFLPADTIIFPKQSFSFEERKIASTVIGTLVFIHKKDKPWNAYVSSSDFQILSGNETVSASNLSIIPGPIIPINNSKIDANEVQRGQKHRLEDTEDQAVLVTTDSNEDAMFIMRPRLELILPPSTRAGLYKGTLTITYIDRS